MTTLDRRRRSPRSWDTPAARVFGRGVRVWLAAALLLAVSASAMADEKRTASNRAALESINAARLKAHVEWLAHDDREGREAGTPGGYAAGDYIAEHMAKWKLQGAGVGASYVQAFAPNYRNLLGLLPGRDPALRGEYILIGAHYDHVGYALRGATLGRVGELHNGADDNASGTSGLLQLAQAMTLLPERPRRSILFAFWDAEELGMLGSKHWAARPTLPLEQVKFCLNLDMIGRLRDRRLMLFASRSGYGLRRLVAECNESTALRLEFPWPVAPIADHYSLFAKNVPVLGFYTGEHADYHRPSDKSDRIEAEGMQAIDRLLFHVVCELADADRVPSFREAVRGETAEMQQNAENAPPKLPERLGVRWDPADAPQRGVRLTEVISDSAADRAGLTPGDRILKFAGRDIRSDDDIVGAVCAAPTRTTVLVERGGRKPAEMPVELSGGPLRLGITWRVDDAEPGVLILTRVVAGTPSALAGLLPGDRILRMDGRSFATEREAVDRLRNPPAALRLRLERRGQVLHVELNLDPTPVRRAA
jgi:hypothetical protein